MRQTDYWLNGKHSLKTIYDYKVVVRGSHLQRYIELLRKMYEYEATPVKLERGLNRHGLNK